LFTEVEMEKFIGISEIDQAAAVVRGKTSQSPVAGIILGSGLGGLADSVQSPDIIPYQEIPNWPISSVVGHKGRLVIGTLEGKCVLVMQGRTHYYEGYSMDRITFPIRVMQRLGIRNLIVTNAAGAINPGFQPGDVMMITDQINLIGMAGLNPLRGPNLEEFGERFPDMSKPYDAEFAFQTQQVASQAGIDLKEGVYICLSGPSFESPADLRFLRLIGADAVGMSTVPEVIIARHGGMRVLGFSGISNKANLDGSTVTTHEEVLQAGEMIVPKLSTLIRGVLKDLN
jgi:purine-nucleoside phosphorylase